MKNLSEIIHDLDMVTKQYVDDAAAAKVDKVEGKQLSTNDFTTEEKEKLAGLSITQYSTLPTANMKTYKDIIQYVGNTTEEYTTGYFYQCQKLEVGYGWVAIDVQDIDWSNLNNYSTNMVVAKATTDDAETGIYNIKIKSLPTAYAYGGLPLDIIYDENGEAPANVLKLFAGNVVATASIKAAERTALFSGTNFYVTYNGVKKKIEVPKADSTPTNAQVGYILQDLISNAFGSNILKVGPSGMKMAFSLNDFGGGANWTDGAPTIIIEDGDENNALIPLHIDNGSVLGFNINLPLNQLLDASVFVDGVYTLNLQSGVAANGTIFWQSESFNFLETDTIGKVFETINNSKLTIHIYYDAINNRIMIESTVGGPSGVFDLGEDWTLWNALNITDTLRTNIDQYIADGGYIGTGANGYFDLTSPSGQVFTDVILTTKQCYFRGIEFNFANANPNESYLIAVTTQKSEDGTYTTLENKPTLNGVEIDGDKTALDYGINDTNVYYGTEEPTAENVVMWVDPNGADVSVLTTDNAIEYTPTGDYNPATKKYVDDKVANIDIPEVDLSGYATTAQLAAKANTSDVLTKTNTTVFTPTAEYHPATKKYVDEHGVNTDEIYGMDNYETLQLVSQDDISEPTTSDNIVGQIDNSTTGTVWSGHIINKLDTSVWDFNITSNEHNLALIKSPTSSLTAIALSPYSGGTAYGTLDYLNTALKRTSYDSGSYIMFRTYQQSQKVNMVWDFKRDCTPIFHGRGTRAGSTSSYYGSAKLYGSNNNINWVNLSAVNGIVDYTVTTPYRYFKLEISLSGGGTGTSSSSEYQLYYSYFTNVADTIPKYRNNFTSTNDFSKKECVNVIVPSYEYDGYIGQNTINNIPVNFVLNPNIDYKLRYDGEKIITDRAKVITGAFASSSSLQTINLGFSPDLVICYVADNNTKGVGGSSTSTARYCTIPRILTKAYFHADVNNNTNGQIVDGGFSYVDSSTGTTIYYIAIRF